MKRVLVIDDEYVVLDALSMLLEAEGFRVRKAANGAEGWARLEEEAPDFVICDEQMPVLGGAALIAKMGSDARFEHVPVILLVEAFGKRRSIPRATSVLVKPLRLELLLRAIQDLALDD